MSRAHRPGGRAYSYGPLYLTSWPRPVFFDYHDTADAFRYAFGVDPGLRDRTARTSARVRTVGENGKPVIDVEAIEVAPPARALVTRRR